MQEQKQDLSQKIDYEQQRELMIRALKEHGCRITKQRLLLIDILLKEECTSCKDIYYYAVRQDKTIGPATVYRMVKLLEDIGVISRKNMYQFSAGQEEGSAFCKITLNDHTVYALTENRHRELLEAGLDARGYLKDEQTIEDITFS